MDAVIFDMDGVLADTESLHFDAVNKVLAPFGKRLPDEKNSEYLGMDLPAFWEVMIEMFQLEAAARELAAVHADAVIQGILKGIQALPGVEQCVSGMLMRGLVLAVGTSSPRNVTEAVLEELGLRRTFKVVVTADDVPHGKPEPDIFLEASHRLGVSPEDCMVIEDSPKGLLAARRAGMFAVAVRNRDNIDLDLEDADRIFSGLNRFDWTLVDER